MCLYKLLITSQCLRMLLVVTLYTFVAVSYYGHCEDACVFFTM